jgi:hypothetical protein
VRVDLVLRIFDIAAESARSHNLRGSGGRVQKRA